VICFSLWGDNPKYTIGAIKNAKLALEIYPGWICKFYVGHDVPAEIITKLQAYDHVELIKKKSELWDSMFWRFYAMSDDIDAMLSRDADSRLNWREKAAVDVWMQSGKAFHIMRDHRWHNVKILGGMHGCRGNVIPNIKKLISDYLAGKKRTNYYQVDQEFLQCVIFPKIKNNLIIHDDILSANNPWPVPRKGKEYVGAPFDENDKLLIEFIP